MAVITIKQEPSTNKNLAGVRDYSFQISLGPPDSPYPQLVKHIATKTLVDKVLEGYAVLAVHTTESYTDSWTGRRENEPFSETTQFGIEPVSNLDRVDKRLYDKLKEELEKFKKQGYKFEIKDETKYAQELAAVHQ